MSSFDIPSISFSGLASGLDTSAIISSLVAYKRMPINLLETQKANYQNKITYFNTLKSRMDDLKKAVDNLKDEKDYDVFSTTLSEEGVLTAKASSSATPGTYSVEVTDLATFEQEASGNFADKTSSLGSGTVTIDVGGTVTDIVIEDGQDTLEGLVAAINNSDAEVSASIVNDGSDTPYRLVITGKNTGEDNTVSISTVGLAGLGSFTELQSASDAHFEINNITMQSASNSVTSAVEGLSLNLTGTTAANDPVIVTVGRDSEEIKSNIQSFVSAYNSVMTFINQQSTYNETTDSGGVLMGENMLQRIQSNLQSTLIPSTWDYDPSAPEIQILAQIGISFENDGTLEVSSSELDSAIEDNFDDVVRLFSESDNGFALEMFDFLKEHTKLEGVIDNKTDGIETIIRNLDTQISRAEDRLDNYESGLVRKFATLEELMSGLNSQQSMLYFQNSK